MSDKDAAIAQGTRMLELESASRQASEEAVSLSRAELSKMQERFEAAVGEINKGNTIIERLRSEYRTLRTKLKTKSAVARQQEALLAERLAASEALAREVAALREASLSQRDRMDEALDVLVPLLRGETVTKKTDWFELNNARLQMTPYSRPSVEMAVASQVSPTGARAAGKHDF